MEHEVEVIVSGKALNGKSSVAYALFHYLTSLGANVSIEDMDLQSDSLRGPMPCESRIKKMAKTGLNVNIRTHQKGRTSSKRLQIVEAVS